MGLFMQAQFLGRCGSGAAGGCELLSVGAAVNCSVKVPGIELGSLERKAYTLNSSVLSPASIEIS